MANSIHYVQIVVKMSQTRDLEILKMKQSLDRLRLQYKNERNLEKRKMIAVIGKMAKQKLELMESEDDVLQQKIDLFI